MLRIGEAAAYLGVSKSTLRRWDRNGCLLAQRTPGRHRRYDIHTLDSIFKKIKELCPSKNIHKHILCYARVSGHKQKQKGDLARQMDKLVDEAIKRGDTRPITIMDVGSGLNSHRSGLKKLFRLIMSGTISTILVTFKDRLTRFGFPFIEHFCDLFSVIIIETEQICEISVQQSLVDDMMSLIACFSGKLYGMRSAKRRKKISQLNKIECKIKKTIHLDNERAIETLITRILAA